MAKRDIPLFIIDHTRNHKLGECGMLQASAEYIIREESKSHKA